MHKPRFGLHWINALFMIGFGSSLIWARLPTAAGSMLPKMGLSIDGVGYFLILCGSLMFVVSNRDLQFALCFGLLPYTIASFVLFFNNHTAQSMTVFSFIQVALFILIQADSIIRGDT